ncbi:DedA family protein [Actinoplanes sp. NPDC004185]
MLADLFNAATVLVDRLTTLDEWSVLLFTYLSAAVEMTFLLGLLVPGESVVMLSASLHGPGGFALAVAAGTAGALTGQICGYAIGRVFGTRLRTTRLGRRIGAERFDRAEDYLRERGAPALVAVRFVAVIHAVVPIVAGVARMPFGRFLGWSALGTVLWVGTFAGVGAATASADSTGGVGVVLTAIAATCLGVIPFAVRLFRRSPAAAPVGGPVEGGVQALRVGAEQRPGAEKHRPAPAVRPARDDRRLLRPAHAGPGRLPVARRRVESRAGRATSHHATAAQHLADRRLGGRGELRVRQPLGNDRVGPGVQQGRGDRAHLEAHLPQREQLVGGDRGLSSPTGWGRLPHRRGRYRRRGGLRTRLAWSAAVHSP